MSMEASSHNLSTSVQLSDTEQMFIYQLEIIGMPVQRAAEVAGVNSPYALLKKPYIIAAREAARLSIRGRTNFTREDVIFGIHEAIDQAKILADPMAQIAGWREIGKLLGYDKTPNVNIHISGNAEQVKKQLQNLSSDELAKLSGEDVLDGDFYQVNDNGA